MNPRDGTGTMGRLVGTAGGSGWTPQWVAVCGSTGSGTGARVLASKGGTRCTAKTQRDHAGRDNRLVRDPRP